MAHHTALALVVFGTLVSPTIGQNTPTASLESARTALASAERSVRLEALNALVSLGGAQALELVVQSLASDDPFVADRAQWRIVSMEEAGAFDALLGRHGVRSRNLVVQQRAAEAIGRLYGPVNAQDLLRPVRKRNEPLARTLLWSLERLAQRNALSGKRERTIKSVRAFTGQGDPDGLRASAIQTLSILDPHDGAVSMDNLSGDCGIETACALMDVSIRLQPQTFDGVLQRGMVHPEAAVRMGALDRIVRTGVRRCDLEALVERVNHEPRVAVRTRVVEVLQYFTGYRIGDDYTAWREYAGSLSPDWTSVETKNAYTKHGITAGDFDLMEQIAPTSDRIAVLVDVSRSFWEPTTEGHSLPSLVGPAVGRLLRRIEQTGCFLLIPFGEKPIPFSDEPIPACGANVQRALDYLVKDVPSECTRCGESGIGAAIDHALTFKQLDRIVIISASSEYAADHANAGLMASLYGERTRFRPAIFDFVLLNVDHGTAAQWGTLAHPRGGRVFLLDVP